MKKQKEKHVPMRTCIQTREKLPKKELLHFVYLKDEGKLIFDPKSNAKGRGANLKNDMETFEAAIKSRAFNRAFKVNISIKNIEIVRKEVTRFLTRKNLLIDNDSNGKNISSKIKVRVKVDEKVKLG